MVARVLRPDLAGLKLAKQLPAKRAHPRRPHLAGLVAATAAGGAGGAAPAAAAAAATTTAAASTVQDRSFPMASLRTAVMPAGLNVSQPKAAKLAAVWATCGALADAPADSVRALCVLRCPMDGCCG